MSYGEVLKKAWKTIWKHKFLWFFGFFASCTGGVSVYLPGQSYYHAPYDIMKARPGILNGFQRFLDDISQFFNLINEPTRLLIIIVFILAILLLLFILLAIATIGRSGMIWAAWQVDDGAEGLKFMEVMRGCLPFFWRVFLLYFLMAMIIVLLTTTLYAVFFLLSSISQYFILVMMILLIFALGIIIPIAFFTEAMMELSTIAIVVEDLRLSKAIKRAWKIAISRPLHVLVMELILGIGGKIVWMLINLPFLSVLIPIGFLLFAESFSGSWGTAMADRMMHFLIFGFLLLLVYWLLIGVLNAYMKSTWTLAFRRLSVKAAVKEQ